MSSPDDESAGLKLPLPITGLDKRLKERHLVALCLGTAFSLVLLDPRWGLLALSLLPVALSQHQRVVVAVARFGAMP